jgi:Zn/Cd-binding protein ZinT
MKRRIRYLVFVLGAAVTCNAYSSSCKAREYAALKDMSKENLISSYCYYSGRIPPLQKLHFEQLKLADEAMRFARLHRELTQKAEHTGNEIKICYQGIRKMRQIFENKYETKAPNCEK